MLHIGAHNKVYPHIDVVHDVEQGPSQPVIHNHFSVNDTWILYPTQIALLISTYTQSLCS